MVGVRLENPCRQFYLRRSLCLRHQQSWHDKDDGQRFNSDAIMRQASLHLGGNPLKASKRSTNHERVRDAVKQLLSNNINKFYTTCCPV